MNKKQLIGLAIAAVIFVAIGASNVITNVVADNMKAEYVSEVDMLSEEFWAMDGAVSSAPSEAYIGVVSVVGTIQEQTSDSGYFSTSTSGYQHNDMMDFIDEMIEDENNQGILLYIDSPGGTVYESEELYSKIVEYQEATGREVWTYMAHYAASGGYYVTASADEIYANRNTTTGSIGVMISGYDLTGLYEKLGIEVVNVTSGENKVMEFSDEETIEIYQAIIDESYDRFVEIIVDGRGLSLDEVVELADGRIYSASQALELGLIDEISTYDEMQEEMMDTLGVYTFYEPTTTADIWSSLWASVEEVIPKSEAEIVSDFVAELGSGVPMYYAEQLQ